jgi:hypothetical protein
LFLVFLFKKKQQQKKKQHSTTWRSPSWLRYNPITLPLSHFIPNINVVLNPEASLTGQYVPYLTLPDWTGAARSWRTFQMRHTEMGDVRCVAGFSRYRFAWHPEMNTTTSSVRACATLPFTFSCLFVT